jgi:hypothetical protein
MAKEDKPKKDTLCLVKTWESEDCGTVTITTCRNGREPLEDTVKRHKQKIKEMERLCPPKK